MTTNPPNDGSGKATGGDQNTDIPETSASFSSPVLKAAELTDGRKIGEWTSRYPSAAREGINFEARILASLIITLSLLSGGLVGMSGETIQVPITWLAHSNGSDVVGTPTFNLDFRLLAIFFVGSLGGTTFSIKWLVHAVAKGTWHLDRRYWRLFVPLIGGIYACVVLALLDGGAIGGQAGSEPRPFTLTVAFAFLVGYFSDGVSGLLSNIANAVFGTVTKK